MAKNVKEEINNLDRVVELLNKKYGPCAYKGGEMFIDPPRLPSGIFVVDYITGGGFPINQFSVIRGPEHGGKTSLALSAMRMAPRICWRCFRLLEECECSLPSYKMKSVWADVEGTFNRAWAEAIGNDSEDYWVERAESGNMFGEILDYALRADDCGLVVLDSIGALTPGDEMDTSLDGAVVATQARLVSRIARKLRQRLIIEGRRGHPCLVVFINQIRTNIGVMFGNPETSPGGHQIKHESALTLRIAKRSTEDRYKDKEHDRYMAQRHFVSLEKYKNLRLMDSGEFIRATENNQTLGLTKGKVIDQAALVKYAFESGIITEVMEKDKRKLKYKGNIYGERGLVFFLRQNDQEYLSLSYEVIAKAKMDILKSC
jgi:recombination protein RecA